MNTNSTISNWLRGACVIALVLVVAMLPAFLSSCKEDTGPVTGGGGGGTNSVTVHGIVYQKHGSADRQVLPGALVSIRSLYFNRDTTTSTQGTYNFAITLPDTVTAATSGTISFSKSPDFALQSTQIQLKPGLDIPVDFTLSSTDTTSLPVTSGPMASLVYIGASSASATVTGGTGIKTVTFTFEARDTAGIPVDSLHKVKVYFKLKPAIGGGEKITVDSAFTSGAIDRRGRVTTTLKTGVMSGIIQIEATTKSPVVLRTTSLALPIYGGPPSPEHFSISAEKSNFPALLTNGATDKISVQLGDKYSNPVPPGTPVYFSSTTGIIQSIATTGEDGSASAILTSGDPAPKNGIAWVYAQTVGDSGKNITDSVSIVVSGSTVVSPSDMNIAMSNGQEVDLNFHVYDKQWAHPLAAGTHVAVSITGDAVSELVLLGDVDVTLPDTKDTSFTSFSVLLRDTANIVPDPDKSFLLKISVTSPNGNLTRSYQGTLSGTTGGGGGGGSTGPNTKIGSIILANISDNQISVKGTGNKQTSTITFLALDRSGKPITRDSSALIHFRIAPASLGATLFPGSGNTDAQGRVQTVISSGTKAGVAQIQAYADTGGGNLVTSNPIPITIASGLPSLAHFDVAVSRLNIPGLIYSGLKDSITVYLGDVNGNPVQQNTAVYFTSDGGIVSPSVFTNNIGVATTLLQSSDPRPANGIVTVRASTVNDSSVQIQRSAQIVFSGYANIDVAPSSLSIDDGGSQTLTYFVYDKNHNPLSAGTTINATLIGDQAKNVVLTGDLSTTLGDNFSGGSGVTSFFVNLRDTALYNLQDQSLTLRLTTNGPNGGLQRDVPVVLKKTTNPPLSLVKRVLITSIDHRRLTVRSTGDLDSTIVRFEIQDGTGTALPLKNVPISFTFSGAQGSFVPPAGFTDSTGHIQSVFYTGSDTGTAALVGIVGELNSATQNITVLPGKASNRYFKVVAMHPPDTLQTYNFPGIVSAGQKLGQIIVNVKDRYGNPVALGTAIQISSNAGTIQDIGFTDKNGQVKADWFGGNPLPLNGAAVITASVVGESNTNYTSTTNLTYSGAPIISAFAPALPSNFVFQHGVDTAFSVSVKDLNGNPLAKGSTITIKLTGAATSSVILSGAIRDTMKDTRTAGDGVFTFHLVDTNKFVTADQKLGIQIEVDGPNGRTSTEIDGSLKGAPALAFRFIANSVDNNSIMVSGVGALQKSTLGFQLQDSSHNPTFKKGIDLQFVLQAAGGGLSVQHALTDDSGRVSVTYTSGVFVETVLVHATANGINSPVQQILVNAGPPTQSYFALSADGLDGKPTVNYPGMFAVRNPIGSASVRVRDTYGNIVRSGTPVKFTTNAGSLQTFGYTDHDGVATVQWQSGVTFPAGGNAFIKAQAFDAGGAQLAFDSLAVLYSGQAIITGGLPANFALTHGVDTTVTFTIKDSNGNPIAKGSAIKVSLSGEGASQLELTGDVNVTTTDTRDVATTTYSVHLKDTNFAVTHPMAVVMKISVNGPNGNITSSNTGNLAGAPIKSVFGLAVVNITAPTISVRGGDGVETTVLTFELRDSLNRPLPRDSVRVNFTSQGVPGSFSAVGALTDSTGRVQALFRSDTIAGIARVVASVFGTGVVSDNQKISIVGGKPAQKYFTFIMSRQAGQGLKQNFPGGLPLVQKIGVGQVQVGDKYGNPVPPGTPVYFTTNAGIIQGSAVTDANGLASVDWSGGNPKPANSTAVVKASALGAGGQVVMDSIVATYSGVALVTGGLPANYVLKSGIDTTFTYTVSDAGGNPLAEGSQITVTVGGTGASSVLLSGDVNVTTPDTRLIGATTYSVRMRDTNTVITATRTVTVSIAVAGANGAAAQQINTSLKGVTPASIIYPRIASIGVVAVSEPQLTVINSGGTDNSAVTFELRDSVNNPITEAGIKINFIKSGVLGSFVVDTATTDASGRVVAIFRSDSVAGLAQVSAKLASGAVTSNTTRFAIVGGKPAQKYFTFYMGRPSTSGLKVNYPGALQVVQQIGTAQVQMGDKYGNPVAQGTPVYFTTNAGVIQGVAYADANGLASVNWFSGNPYPANGVAVVKASALGANGQSVLDSVTATFSGQALVTGGPAAGFQIQGGGTATYSFKVADSKGNPLAAGNTVHVSVTGSGSRAIALSGNIDETTSDTRDTNSTHFQFTARDTSTFSLQVRDLTFTIDVFGPNGITSTSAVGTLLSTGAGRSRKPGSIALISTSANEIQVTGTGGVETSTMVFELRDSVGVPVDSAYTVNFAMIPSLGGSFISPDSGKADSKTGRINAVVHAGTVAGPLQAIATVTTPSGTISSTPVRVIVHSGQPDQTHMSISTNILNLPGIDVDGNKAVIGVILGDKYSNPVPLGTAVYFSTSEGVVTTDSGFTTKDGYARATLFTANPRSADGFGYVSARTVGLGGVTVKDSVRMLFSGRPIIDSISVTPSSKTDFTVNFRVYDVNHNPLAKDNIVSVTADGDVTVIVSDVFPSPKLPDTQDPYWTHYSFNVVLNRHALVIKTGPFKLSIKVDGPNGSAASNFDAIADQGGLVSTGLSNSSTLQLAKMIPPIIMVNKGGDVDSSTLIYQLADSNGHPIQVAGAKIHFTHTLASGSFNPDTAITDANGQAYTIFRAGSSSGIAHIRGDVVGYLIPRSDSTLEVHSGRPNLAYMSVITTQDFLVNAAFEDVPKFNFPGESQGPLKIGALRVQLGDRYGNIVPESTIISTTTNAGVLGGGGLDLGTPGIIGGQGRTDGNGQVLLYWYGGSPLPPGGNAVITVSVLGDIGTISKSVYPVYTGHPVVTFDVPPNFTFRAGIDTIVTYHVKDVHGNPLAEGNFITVVAGGPAASRVSLSGDVGITMVDTKDTNLTTFHLRIKDISSGVTTNTSLSLSVNIRGRNFAPGSNGDTTVVFNDTLASPVMSTVAGVKLLTTAQFLPPSRLTVKNAGGTGSALMTYQLVDSLGNALAKSGVTVAFVKSGVLSSVVPSTAVSDANGRVQTLFTTDSLAGLAQVHSTLSALNLNSDDYQFTIVGGRPDQSHFTITADQINYPGAVPVLQQIANIRVQVGDRYGNMVPRGTPVYFTTNAGVIQGSVNTDTLGQATVSWFSGNPIPVGGVAKVIASAAGVSGTIQDSITAIFSGSPVITGGLPANFTLRHAIDTTITYSVEDANHNPLSAGALIEVTATGPGADALILSGDLDVTMPDTRDTSLTTRHFRIQDTSFTSLSGRALNFSISVFGPNGTASLSSNGILSGTSATQSGGATPARISLLGITAAQLSVKDGGGVENTLLTYQLQDSLGNSLGQDSVQVDFSKAGVAGTFTPNFAITDANGRVQTAFHSDTVAGLAQLIATLHGSSIKSTEAHVTVVGGKPSSSHFTFFMVRSAQVGIAKVNFPGALQSVQQIGAAQVQVGDKYGNPVPSGTTIYFAANAGLIQSTATTDDKGFATVNWYSGNPIPANELATLTASAIGDAGPFSVNTQVLYSGSAQITGGPSNNFVIPGSGTFNFSYRVGDLAGMPVAEGSTISVVASDAGAAGLVLSGSVQVNVADSKDSLTTFYAVTVRDTSSSALVSRPVKITITVDGPNGSASSTFSGTVLPAGVAQSNRSKLPASIAVVSISDQNIQVVGTGGKETSTFSFVVKDSVGSPVDSAYTVTFTLNNAPFGTFISPVIGQCDTTGRISAILHAGTVSGPVQIVATIAVGPGDTIKSTPIQVTVHSGLPDQRHFTIFPSALNFAGLDIFNQTDQITVIVGDRYGNPVATGTAVYFTTNAGIVQPSGNTDSTGGQATVTLFSGNPLPDAANPDPIMGKGFTRVYGKTTGIDGVPIIDSTLVLFSGRPVISSAHAFANFNLAYGSSITFDSIFVADRFGNPLVGATTINLVPVSTTSFPAFGGVTMPDLQTRGINQTIFSLGLSSSSSMATSGTVTVDVYVQVSWKDQIYSYKLCSGIFHP